jgi:wobble nucleotide-excising tRNase
MSGSNKPQETFRSLPSLAKQIRRDLTGVRARRASSNQSEVRQKKAHNYVLLFAHNGVGKTRLSGAFKDIGKNREVPDTLYYNAFTEDLFYWNNDFENDTDRRLLFRSKSNFFKDLEGSGIEYLIRDHLQRFTNQIDFDIYYDDEDPHIIFYRDEIISGRNERLSYVKISKGEENLFVWCFFLAVAQLAIEAENGQPYDWVKFIYIDDPISSLDENNTITVASDLSRILKGNREKVKAIISTHHSLFFNVMFHELKGGKDPQTGDPIKIDKKAYVLQRELDSKTYRLIDTGESPFLHHIATLQELKKVAKSGKISQYHFNMLRSILEKTKVFFGYKHISVCFQDSPKRSLFTRFLHIRSHSNYSTFEAALLDASDRQIFREILDTFLSQNNFRLPSN